MNIQKASLVKSAPTKSTLYPLNLPYVGCILVELNNIKSFGPQLDSQCTWKMHINYLLNKLSVICFIMRRLVHILNIDTLKVVYFAHLHPLIKFGIIIWGNSTTIHKVFVVQKHILRTKLGIGPRCCCKGWFVKINILPVPSFCIFLLIMFVINNLDSFKTS